MAKSESKVTDNKNLDCFVIMPIADHDAYEKGHFRKVFEDVFKVACNKAGFNAIRADEVKQTNLIHLDILKKLIESPMAICDLSSRNPNVLFELGLRQAFDKPTVLVQERGTTPIFDIAPLRYTEYRKELRYREVLEDQDLIADALRATKDATDRGEGVNSIVNLLSLSNPASLREVTDNDSARMLQIVMSEMNQLRTDFRSTVRSLHEREVVFRENVTARHHAEVIEAERAHKEFSVFRTILENGASVDAVKAHYESLQKQITRAADLAISARRKEQFKDMIYKADELFALYIANNGSPKE